MTGTLRVYIDTSVLGGYFDSEFEKNTRPFVDGLLAGKAVPIVSEILTAEVESAPEYVQSLLEQLVNAVAEIMHLTPEVVTLRNRYLAAGVLTPKWSDDALHVAQAVVADADVIVSWNFKHIVNPIKIKGFDAVNGELGYRPVVIMTPDNLVKTWEAKEQGDDDE